MKNREQALAFLKKAEDDEVLLEEIIESAAPCFVMRVSLAMSPWIDTGF